MRPADVFLGEMDHLPVGSPGVEYLGPQPRLQVVVCVIDIELLIERGKGRGIGSGDTPPLHFRQA